jgi:mannitol-specific phosphotransferase system IIBC component
MVYFYRSPTAIVVSALCSIAIAAFIYFVLVKPSTDNANNQVNHALQQAKPQIDAANKQLQKAASQAPASASPSIKKAQQITTCIAAANGDVNKIAACNK